MKTIVLSRIKATLGTDKGDTELDVWLNYYFIVPRVGGSRLKTRGTTLKRTE